jgi:LacI family transcriptional regulator
MAMGCFEALKELGKRIPEDVAVIGFDNREIAQFLRPPLTTLVLPQYDMGFLAVEQLLDLVGGLKPRQDQLKVECQLIERESVDPPRTAGASAAQ